MTAQPLVSIAIPAYNPEFLHRALFSAISQTYPNLEVIVCDDSRGEAVKAVFDDWAGRATCTVRYVRNPQTLGFAGNLLACLEQAQGEFIKFLCDDDWLIANCISEQAQVLVDCPDVSMVINHRLICAADESPLPARPANCVIAPERAVLYGTDLIEAIATWAPNLFGGISHSLLRREQVQAYLPQLVAEGEGFQARLDLALYICLLRRGHLAYLENMLSLERVHPAQLSHQAGMTLAFKTETQWLLQMLESRTNEAAPATGWVRYVPLGNYHAGPEQAWEEFELTRLYSGQMAGFQQQVGSNSLSAAEVYAEWLNCRVLSSAQVQQLPKRIEQWPQRPRIVPVIIDAQDDALALKATLDSLAAQSYGASQVWVLGSGAGPAQADVVYVPLRGNGLEQLNERLAHSDNLDWLLLLQAGDRLQPHALVIMAERMALRPDRLCVYADEGCHDGLEASQPIFKPDFNLDLMRSFPFVGRVLAFQRQALLEQGGFNLDFDLLAPQDLLWRLVEAQGLHVVEHIAELLVECQYNAYAQWLSDPAGIVQAPRVVQAHLQRLGVEAELDSASDSMLTRVRYQHAGVPAVSIIIPAGQQLPSLMRCVESIFEHTAYSNYEILVVARGDEPPELQGWISAMRGLDSAQLRMLDVTAADTPTLFNQAASQARGDYLLLLDSDCLVIEGKWLGELMSQAQRPEVGVVGPKFCNPAGAVVGAGLVLGLHGPAGSPFIGQEADAAGYMNRLRAVQNWSAVSADCLLVRRDIFEALGGLDAEQFATGLFDADLCLRVRDQGYLVVWTPFALLVRMGGVAEVERNAVQSQRLRDEFYQRWLPRVAYDPAYNRNLSLKMSSFQLDAGLRSGWDPFLSRTLPFVLALPINTTAIGHYRVTEPFKELESAGWIQGRVDYSLLKTIELERDKPDAIILQCRYMTSSIEEFARIKRFSSARRIYEIDDYIIGVPEKNAHGRNMPGNIREMLSRGIGMCDRVVVSTQPLAEALSSMHQDIRMVPNMLAPRLWQGHNSQRQTSIKPRVGWAGGTSHRGDLELLAEVVRELADEVDWVFFGMCPEVLRPYIKEFHSGVALELYPRKLASLNLDLALAPLESNLFNDCKSNLRLLEYGACGFPVICSDAKAYEGYLPCTRVRDNSTQAWLEAIRMHLADPKASYRLGDELREVVLRDYVLTPDKLQHWANAWLAD